MGDVARKFGSPIHAFRYKQKAREALHTQRSLRKAPIAVVPRSIRIFMRIFEFQERKYGPLSLLEGIVIPLAGSRLQFLAEGFLGFLIIFFMYDDEDARVARSIAEVVVLLDFNTFLDRGRLRGGDGGGCARTKREYKYKTRTRREVRVLLQVILPQQQP